METRTITVKSSETKSGVKNDGTKWRRVSIKATDGKFYSTFSPIPEEALKEGTQLKVAVTPSKLANTYDIDSIISHANPTHTSGEVRSPDSGITPLPAQLSAAKSYAKELLASATALAPKEWEGTSEYPYLVATLVQVMHGKISGERIAAQEEEKIKAYGNKKW